MMYVTCTVGESLLTSAGARSDAVAPRDTPESSLSNQSTCSAVYLELLCCGKPEYRDHAMCTVKEIRVKEEIDLIDAQKFVS